MSSNTPFSLRIFVADGDPDGLRLVERSNWIGKAVIFPRALYPKVRARDEFQQTGVYLLIGPRESGDGDQLYVGEGDPVRPRLEQHYAKKDFWTKAVFFVAGQGQLNKAHVQYLEAQLIQRATAAKRVPLENGNTPTEPTLSEADRADMDVFLGNILGMLPVLGVHAFEQATPRSDAGNRLLKCQGKGIVATGWDTAQGFVVRSGSFASKEITPSLEQYFRSTCDLRQQLLESGVLIEESEKLKFAQDYTFSSPSQAAQVVLGRSANGRTDWKDSNGKTLKALQEEEATK
jgi:hypothetical protein